MHTLNNKNRIDGFNEIVEHALEMKAKKTPWHLRFAGKMKTAAAVVVGVVGIGLLASAFFVQANDEEKTNDAPEVSCLWVENHGSAGFTVDFDVSLPSDSDKLLTGFQLKQSGVGIVDEELWVKRTSLYSDYCGWLSIPGFDGGPPLPYPGYSHSFDFVVEGLELDSFVPLGGFPIQNVHGVASSVSVQLYVEVNSNGSLRSMNAWAVDSDGDNYEIPLYYSPGGSENFRTFED